jgi:ribosome-binding ATPase
MRVGLIGLPNSGKTTIFNLLTEQSHPTENFYSQQSEVHLGTADVIDPRLWPVFEFEPRAKQRYAEIDFVDMAGIVIEDSGRSKKSRVEFLNNLRDVEAMVFVVRGFDRPDVMQPFPDIDPVRDIETIEMELVITDLEVVENRLGRINKELSAKKDKTSPERDLLERCKELLDEGTPLRDVELNPDEEKLIRTFRFLSRKPALVLYNIDEGSIAEGLSDGLESFCSEKKLGLIDLSAEVELEVSQLEAEEQKSFLEELGIEEPARGKFVRATYALLNLISYFTVGPKEVRAWTITRGTNAVNAAGKVHSDIQRGFIRAEVFDYDTFIASGGWSGDRKLGTFRLEGKEYIVNDGDIMNFRFSV